MAKKSRSGKRKSTRQASRSQGQSIKKLANPGRKPSRAASLVAKAAAAWNELDFDKALKFLHTAHQAERGNVDVLLDLGRACLLRYDPETAQAWFEKALKLGGESAAVHLRIGESYRKLPRYDLAEPYFEKAAAMTDCPVDGITDFAVVAERLHHLESAQSSVDRILEKEPDHAVSLLTKAKLQRRSGDLPAAEITLRDLVSRDLRREDVAWQARYELARILDSQGDFEAAMKSWLDAKKILNREGSRFTAQSASVFHETKRILDTISTESFERWHSRLSPSMRKVAVLTGHPRSGTTLLEQILDSHDGLISSDESTIFGDDVTTPLRRRAKAEQTFTDLLDDLTAEDIESLSGRYFDFTEIFIGEPLKGRLLLDKNPALTMQLPSMCAVLSGLKIVFAVRDPRDVVMSCFKQSLFMNSISCNYLDLGKACHQYTAIMESWLKIRDLVPNPWTEIRYEDLVGDAEGESRRILEFLGLSWDPNVLNFHERAGKRFVSSPTYEAVTKKIHKGAVGQWKNYERYLEPHLEILQPYVEAFGYA